MAAQAKLDPARAVVNKARPSATTRSAGGAALSIPKLRVRLTEKLGAPGVYDELSAWETPPKKKSVAPPPP